MQNLSLINYSASPFVGLMTCAVMREAGLLACHVRQFLALFQPLVYVLTVRTGRAALRDITGLSSGNSNVAYLVRLKWLLFAMFSDDKVLCSLL